MLLIGRYEQGSFGAETFMMPRSRTHLVILANYQVFLVKMALPIRMLTETWSTIPTLGILSQT